MSEWKEYKLGEVAEIVTGYPFPGEKYEATGNLRVVRGENVTIGDLRWDSEKHWNYGIEGLEKYLLRSGDIVIGMDGSRVGNNRAQIKESDLPLILAQRVACLRAKNGFSQDYLWYSIFAESYKKYVEAIQTGTSIPHISQKQIADFEIMCPEEEEQRQIAGVLGALDEKIDLLNRENATLEALAETLFRHYFIENPNPTWKEGKLGDYVIETIGGEWGTETSEGESNMSVRCLRGADVADLNDGIATRTPLRYVKTSKYEKIKPNNGDVILEISGGTDTCSTGRVAYINEGVKQLFDYPIVFSNFCRLLRVKEEYTYFVYCYFRHLHKQGEFFNLENGSSGIHNLNYKAALYDDLGWPVPTDEKLVVEFGEKVKPYFDKINTNKKQILSLSAQRDTMLPRLMSGEVKVGER